MLYTKLKTQSSKSKVYTKEIPSHTIPWSWKLNHIGMLGIPAQEDGVLGCIRHRHNCLLALLALLGFECVFVCGEQVKHVNANKSRRILIPNRAGWCDTLVTVEDMKSYEELQQFRFCFYSIVVLVRVLKAFRGCRFRQQFAGALVQVAQRRVCTQELRRPKHVLQASCMEFATAGVTSQIMQSFVSCQLGRMS